MVAKFEKPQPWLLVWLEMLLAMGFQSRNVHISAPNNQNTNVPINMQIIDVKSILAFGLCSTQAKINFMHCIHSHG